MRIRGDPAFRRAQGPDRVADERLRPRRVGGPHGDGERVVAGGLQHREQRSRPLDVPVQRGRLRELSDHQQFQVVPDGVLLTRAAAGHQDAARLAQAAERLLVVSLGELLQSPRLQAVRAYERIGGRLALFQHPPRQRPAAIALQALGMRRPAGVEEDGGVEFPVKAPGQVLGSFQQIDRRGAVHREHSPDRDQLRQGGQLRLGQARRPRDLHGGPQVPLGGLERRLDRGAAARAYQRRHGPARIGERAGGPQMVGDPFGGMVAGRAGALERVGDA